MTEQTTFVAGGTVQAGGGYYIPRQADAQLSASCLAGEFAYVLSTRQVGKSSLMIRTAESLVEQGIRPAVIDLTQIGTNVDAEKWCKGFLLELEMQLDLGTNVIEWWKKNAELGAAHRLTLFFKDVLLREIQEPIVVFVDEIDTTLSLGFTDDFFAAIRSTYNARLVNPEFKRLSFVLLGVAAPNDLIKDANRTPFNIGRQIKLTDFTVEEALPLADGLGLPSDQGRQVLGWVLDWTGGHPYLTQQMCRLVIEENRSDWSESQIDELVVRFFLGEKSEQEKNLQFVRDMLTRPERARNVEAVLTTYRDVCKGRQVPDEDRSSVVSHLKISGVVHGEGGMLKVRNNIYREVFNLKWIQECFINRSEQSSIKSSRNDSLSEFLLASQSNVLVEFNRNEQFLSSQKKIYCYFYVKMNRKTFLNRDTTVEIKISQETIKHEVKNIEQEDFKEIAPDKPIVIELIPKNKFTNDKIQRTVTPPKSGKPVDIVLSILASDIGSGCAEVIISQGGISLKSFNLKTQIVQNKNPYASKISKKKNLAEIKPQNDPDLVLEIEEEDKGSFMYYKFRIQWRSMNILNKFESKFLRLDRIQYIKNIYKKIEDKWILNQDDTENFTKELCEIGCDLFVEIFPENLQNILWEHRERLKSMQIYSTEPFIPWELVHLKQPGGALPSKNQTWFLGQLGAVRWLYHGTLAPVSLKLRKNGARYVIPNYQHSDYELAEAEKERLFLEKNFKAIPIPPNSKEVRKALSEDDFDLLHFACHGEADPANIEDANLLLGGRFEKERYILDTLHVRTVSHNTNWKSCKRTPLVVVNACQSGRAGYKLTSFGGFAQAFLTAGAGAFVGSLWEVGDAPARTFIETFYKALKANSDISEAAIKAREAARKAGDATWLAYVVYGHPHATLEMSE